MREKTNNQEIYQQTETDKFVDKRCSNVKSDLIEITHDKLENILLKYLKNLSIAKSWITPVSLGITLLIAKLTATFNKTFGIDVAVCVGRGVSERTERV
jgi:L-fucose isomerase-like protein